MNKQKYPAVWKVQKSNRKMAKYKDKLSKPDPKRPEKERVHLIPLFHCGNDYNNKK